MHPMACWLRIRTDKAHGMPGMPLISHLFVVLRVASRHPRPWTGLQAGAADKRMRRVDDGRDGYDAP